MKKRGFGEWLHSAAYGVFLLGFALFALQFLLLGIVRGGSHGQVRTRPYFVPRPIEDAAKGEGRIYLLYGDSGAVNVYDSEGGFLWAVSIPWHDHAPDARMRLWEDSLYLYQRGYDIYRFDRGTGELLASRPWEGNEEEFPDERSPEAEGDPLMEPGAEGYDDLTVYRIGEDGERIPLIRRGGWVRFLYFTSAWLLAFGGGVTMVILEANGKRKSRRGQ